eukprot:750484-Hanusia_phi.AAC.1
MYCTTDPITTIHVCLQRLFCYTGMMSIQSLLDSTVDCSKLHSCLKTALLPLLSTNRYEQLSSQTIPSCIMQNVVNVKARPRRGDERESSNIEIDLQTVESLYHLRQEDAAAALGISLTSLKSACRRLGVQRWPYSRNRNQSGADSPHQFDTAEVEIVPPTNSITVTTNVPIVSGLTMALEQNFHNGTNISSASQNVFRHQIVTDSEILSSSSEPQDTDLSSQGVQTLAPSWIEWFVNAKDTEPVSKDDLV